MDVFRAPRRAIKRVVHFMFGRCFPVPTWQEGADHTGIDAYLKCHICGRRTFTYVECEAITPQVRKMLKAEWSLKNTTIEEPTQ